VGFYDILFAATISGIILVIVSLVMIIRTGRKIKQAKRDDEFAVRAINASIAEVDGAIEELNKTARAIFDELEEKHQELLFLYSMADKKKAVGAANGTEGRSVLVSSSASQTKISRKEAKNPKLGKIRNLYDQGMSEDEIAKTLGIGVGEVKLILSLGKGR
jgi:hypothetical protein